ncbi:MAG TPA: hypothetical protein VF681_10345 [Abditibacteriaceae bacterium]|jgi:hypothetical protein
MGIIGGMILWDRGYAKLDGMIFRGGALRANNSDTLAWIAGAARTNDVVTFTTKNHYSLR